MKKKKVNANVKKRTEPHRDCFAYKNSPTMPCFALRDRQCDYQECNFYKSNLKVTTQELKAAMAAYIATHK